MCETTLTNLETEIEKYQRRIEKVYEDYLDEKIPEDLYNRKFEDYRKSQKSVQNKRQNIELIEEDYYGTITHLLSLAKSLPELFQASDINEKRNIISLVLSNLELDGDLLRWEIKKLLDTMAFL